MGLASEIIARAEAIKAEEGRYPVMCLSQEDFQRLLAECNVKGNGMPVRLRGIKVRDYVLERSGEWTWSGQPNNGWWKSTRKG